LIRSTPMPCDKVECPTLWNRWRGAVFMGLASCSAASMQLGIKSLSLEGMVIPQMILMRSAIVMVMVFILSRVLKLPYGVLGPPNMRWILLTRATLGGVALAAGMAANVLLPLGDAVSLTLIYPAIMLVLSPIVGEPYLLLDFVALVVSLVGATLIAEPAFIFGPIKHTNLIGAGVAVLGAIFLALGGLLVRRIGGQAHPVHIVTYFTALPVLPSLIWCGLVSDSITYKFPLTTVMWLILMTLGALMMQLFMSYSLQIETITYINDYIFFNSIPTIVTLAGAALITLPTIYSTLMRQ
ncbi:hypothetical protein L0F63_007360, partial [Massospora cicadina]